MNEDTVLRSSNANFALSPSAGGRNAPLLPPRPSSGLSTGYVNNYNSYSPYQTPYSNYGYNSFNSVPYRGVGFGSMGYNSLGNYNTYGVNNYNSFGGPTDDAERRFIQYAEERSRSAFASVESVVRTINSISSMLDNTFFAMISSFRAILSVAESFGHMRNMFGQIWYSISLYRLFKWMYRKFLTLLGYKMTQTAVHTAWNEVTTSASVPSGFSGAGGSNWPTLAFFGALMSAPYIISKFFLPKYEDRYNPEKWKTPGVRAKAAFDFVATNPNEMSLKTNDEILLAPTYIQEEMKLTNTGWAFAIGNGKSGLIPLNYIVFVKKNNGVLKSARDDRDVPVPRVFPKRVSFGENQIIETNTSEPVITISQSQKSAASNNSSSDNNSKGD